MANTIKIKRGLKNNLPALEIGEMGYCTDTNELFIGTNEGNVLINVGDEIARTATPTVTITEVGTTTVSFTIKNNSDNYPALVRYEINQSPPLEEEITLEPLQTSEVLTITDLADNTTFSLFTQALILGEIFSNITENVFTTDEIIGGEYGIQWNQSTDTVTRLGDGIGLTSGSDFTALNDTGVWNLRRCMVNDNLSINYYIDPTDPTKIGEVVNTETYTTGGTANYTGSHGQVMVEIPKFYWYYEEPSSNVYQWWVSPIEFDANYEVHPAFMTGATTKDYIYMSAFEGKVDTNNISTGKLRSVSGVQPDSSVQLGTTNGRITEFRTFAQNRGTGWQLQTYWATNALQILYSIEYANFDSQTTIGKGYVDAFTISGNISINTGATISLGNTSGAASGTNGLSAISYRGVENFWGNIFKWVDGLNIKNSEVFVANENFASDTFTGSYTSVGTLIISTKFESGFVSNIRFPHFLATAISGSSTSHLYDRHIQNVGNRVAFFGGAWDAGLTAGAFYWNLGSDSSVASSGISSRLQIL